MCGIAGAMSFSRSGFPVSDAYLTAMRDALAHRGPDGAGNWISSDGRVGLAHRRLSTSPFSSVATQPLGSPDGSLWIVLDGHVYNQSEVRAELERLGQPRSNEAHSSAALVLRAFEQWGIDCVGKLRGIFAFALWDDRKRELWLVRDRMGVKPLCFSIHNDRITFASDVKALLQDPDQPRSVNEEAFYHYLTFTVVPPPQTLFGGISKLGAATWLQVKASGEVREAAYWDALDYSAPLTDTSDEAIAERVLDELRTAVRISTPSDAPVGVFLSGGIDSSTIAQLIAEVRSEPVKTFSLGNADKNLSAVDEMPYARLMAKHLGADHHERLITVDDVIDFLPQLPKLQDEPVADQTCAATYYVSKLARENGVPVVLTGDGGDGLFCGSSQWLIWLKLQRMNDWPVPRPLKKLGLLGLRLVGKGGTFPYERMERGATGTPIFWSGSERFTNADKHALMSERLRNRFQATSSFEAVRPLHEKFQHLARDKSYLNWMTYVDLKLDLPEWMLMRTDKMAMAASVGTRAPFLDHKLVEYSMSIPESVKLRNGTQKYILKKAVRGLVPDEIIDRRKQGFGIPAHDWFGGKLGKYARDRIDEMCRHTDFFDHAAVIRFVEEAPPSKQKTRQQWLLLSFALWWHENMQWTGRGR